MSRLLGRASAFLFLVLSVVLAVLVVPNHTEAGFGGSISPATMPAAAAVLIGIGAFFALFEPSAEDQPDYPILSRAFMFIALIGAGIGLIAVIGFRWAAPILSLAIMMVSHERRLIWLAAGAGGVPLAIWVCFEVLLGRPLD